MSHPAIYLDAVLEPPKSLSRPGYRALMLGLVAVGGLLSVGFLLVGAWPVSGFMGLELLALWLVFRATLGRGTAQTHVRVTAEALDLHRVDARGRVASIRLPAPFVRVRHDQNRSGAAALRVEASGRSFAIGDHLTEDEQRSFARRLQQALAEARRERADQGEIE